MLPANILGINLRKRKGRRTLYVAAESTEYTKKWFVTIRGSPEPRLAIGKLINQAWLR